MTGIVQDEEGYYKIVPSCRITQEFILTRIMDCFRLDRIELREIVPGFRARFVHTEHLTIAFWDIDAGAIMPEHSHPHEQVLTLLEGTFELTVEGAARVLNEGSVISIQPDAVHSGKAVTKCRTIDVFYPVRDDYR